MQIWLHETLGYHYQTGLPAVGWPKSLQEFDELFERPVTSLHRVEVPHWLSDVGDAER